MKIFLIYQEEEDIGYGKLNLLEIMFDRIDDNDFLVYLDAGCHINKFGKKRLIEYFEKFENNDYGILSFQMHNQPEKFWTTKEIFNYFKYKYRKN